MEMLERVLEKQKDEQQHNNFLFQQEEEEEENLENRFSNFDFNNASETEIFDKLNEEEKREFNKILFNLESKKEEEVSNLESLMKESLIWEPWWLNPAFNNFIDNNESLLIEDIEVEKKEMDFDGIGPKVNKEDPDFLKIIKVLPNEKLFYNLIDLSFTYSYVLRYFNGEIFENIEDSVNLICKVSGILGKDQEGLFENEEEAFVTLKVKLLEHNLLSVETILYILQDVIVLLSNKIIIKKFLSEFENLFKEQYNGEVRNNQEKKVEKKMIFKKIKKINYYFNLMGYFFNKKNKKKFKFHLDKVLEKELLEQKDFDMEVFKFVNLNKKNKLFVEEV
ncbi:hypothetical protein HK099_001155 [Clydaea vesicula]|uniref:Uncharacterized protein n=1 Tax=Clydaea vesicula TaxID=447962 RepID=A0AAD5Y1Y6_9FUNG|nr:hypothetical protein HK099_001155 [Clydaea vesicula]